MNTNVVLVSSISKVSFGVVQVFGTDEDDHSSVVPDGESNRTLHAFCDIDENVRFGGAQQERICNPTGTCGVKIKGNVSSCCRNSRKVCCPRETGVAASIIAPVKNGKRENTNSYGSEPGLDSFLQFGTY